MGVIDDHHLIARSELLRSPREERMPPSVIGGGQLVQTGQYRLRRSIGAATLTLVTSYITI